MKCINPNHDHELLSNDEPGKCNDCGRPSHYDEGTGWYHHDDPQAPVCHLTGPHTAEGKSKCIEVPDADSKVMRRLLEVMTEAVNDDIDNLTEELITRAGVDWDPEDDGDIEKYEMPIVDAIYKTLGELLAGMTDND